MVKWVSFGAFQKKYDLSASGLIHKAQCSLIVLKHRSALRPTEVRSYSFDDEVVANDVQVQNQT